ncbi:MAG: DUF480 domain-containing protein [Betaproteobacteria bacterium]|nr:DUF480 domain-containing protein [Betaproteobacteria bacterium]
MNMELSLHETRVIGCLIEKEITTPEQYPLSLNALTNACNQRSNREPVLDLDEVAVQQVLDGLVRKYLVNEQGGFGSRVPKFQHRFCNSNYGTLKFTPQELGVVCELFLRGPQTPGELRSHTARLCRFGDVTEVEAVLQQLAEREDGPFVVRLPREPGKRESRYAHLFSGEVSVGMSQGAEHAGAAVRAEPSPASAERLAQLEQRITALEAEVAVLKRQGADPTAS